MSTVDYCFTTFEGFSPIAELGPYRAEDYWQLPEGAPVELIRGELVMSPAPRSAHQIMVGELYAVLWTAAKTSGGLAIVSPADVVLSDSTILQPDVLYIAKHRRGIVGDRVNGPPDLVVEVLSQGAERRDRVAKLDAYARYEVPEFWIVDYRARMIDFLVLENGRYVVMNTAEGKYQSPRLPELSIDLATFWNEVAQRLPAT
ncbi:MAG: Uma2 family endonuclease [Pirellulales bacterium]|nr:Uma2 family endonuclease [Pirellulales bacterium]